MATVWRRAPRFGNAMLYPIAAVGDAGAIMRSNRRQAVAF